MPKKRKTLKEKKQSQIRKQKVTASPQAETSSGLTYKGVQVPKTEILKDEDSILIVPSSYIKADLKKTLFYACFFTAVLIALYWYLDLGGQNVVVSWLRR